MPSQVTALLEGDFRCHTGGRYRIAFEAETIDPHFAELRDPRLLSTEERSLLQHWSGEDWLSLAAGLCLPPNDGPGLAAQSKTRVRPVDLCRHDLDPQTCTICKRGPSKPKITRSPSVITKHRRFTCIVCGVEKSEDQFPTKTPRPPAMPYRNGDEPCRACRVIVRAERKARGGSYSEATIRVQQRLKGIPSAP